MKINFTVFLVKITHIAKSLMSNKNTNAIRTHLDGVSTL